MPTPRIFRFLIGYFLFPAAAQAADMCQFYEEFCPGYVREAIPGGSYPSFSDTFNVNPASIPTTLTPIGVESTLVHGEGSGKMNFALIKGFPQLGFGMASNNDDTFYAYNMKQALKGTSVTDQVYGFSPGDTAMSSLNFGTAVAPFPKTLLGFIPLPVFGVNLRYNQLTRNWDWQYGASLNTSFLTVGYSHRKSVGSNENASIYAGRPTLGIPTITTNALSVALNLKYISADYTVLSIDTASQALQILEMFSKPVTILTVRLAVSAFSATVAQRQTYDINNNKVSTTLVAAAWNFLPYAALGYQRNYVPGAHSLSLQVLF